MTEVDEARDWRGNELDCSSCRHQPLTASGGCRARHACVCDRYARRIDRFFAWNRHLANEYLDHPYFEVRAVAAKYADVFRLTRLLGDPDETVRWSVAQRLPERFLHELCNDEHREVRIRVAARAGNADLYRMRNDRDYYVRMIVARRLSPPLLPLLMSDSDAGVRRIVARRIDPAMLTSMSFDTDADVRLEVAQRLRPDQLGLLVRDPDCRIRYEVANRGDERCLRALLDDVDDMIRDAARERLSSMHSSGGGTPARTGADSTLSSTPAGVSVQAGAGLA